jgi:hypothetical protein
MLMTYPARYTDRLGTEQTTILNDGDTLTMTLRGVTFQGPDFDSFEPLDESDPALLSSFALLRGSLWFCTIEAEIPLPVVTPTDTASGRLTFELGLRGPTPPGLTDEEHLVLRLAVNGKTYASAGTSGWFEDEMLDLQRQLPPGTFMKACINCAFSDYSPIGHGLFGGLACFRGNKAGYRAVTSKRDIFAVWNTLTEFVQETHLCPEFERRKPGTGYRG